MGTRSLLSLRLFLIALVAFAALCPAAQAQGDQSIYTDSLQNGWQSYGWAALDYSNNSPVHSGQDSIGVIAGGYQALYVHHAAFDSTPYTALTFWINGGAGGGQTLRVQAELNGTAQASYSLATLTANAWQQVTIPLTALGVAGQSSLDGFWIQNTSGAAAPTFYVDDITLAGNNVPLPTSAHLSVNAGQTVRTLDGRVYGLNTAFWDYHLGDAASLPLLQQMQTQILRYPGGSSADAYDWSTTSGGSPFPSFAALAAAAGAQGCITVNYGSGTPEMAAAWVAYANGSPANTTQIGVDAFGRDWHTAGDWAALRAAAPLAADDGQNFLRMGRPAPFGFHSWEIGNECYGTWENDQHGVAQGGGTTPLTGSQWDPYTYAQYAAQFFQKMKAVDPTIKIGAVGITGEDTDGNGRHAVPNPAEGGAPHSGWTPVALATLRALGVTPDFLIYHDYPQAPGAESDSGLLATSGTGWASAAADLRAMLTDYVGAAGAGVELVVTENNSVYTNPGKQSVSLVNGLYLADSVGSLAQTEFNGLLWWDFRNGSLAGDNNGASLYGWRPFGDYGMVAAGDRPDTPLNTPYPTFYAAKLLTHWARGGDRIVPASSDDARLAVYAAQLQGGGLALLVINKDATHDLTGHIALAGFTPAGAATVFQYGKPQDLAGADLAQTTIPSAGAAFDALFPSYSMTVIGLAAQPAATTVSGTVTLPGWKGTVAPTPSLTFTLTPTGTTPGPALTATLAPTPTSAAPCSTLTYTLTGVPPGTYTLGVKGPLWLREDVPGGVNTTGGSVTGASVSLPAGDATGNNVVDSADLGALRNAYNTVLGGTRFSAAADFNGDGVVDSADLGLLRNAYNTVGKPF